MSKLLAFLFAFLILFQVGDAQAVKYKNNVVYKVGNAVLIDGAASTKSTVDFGEEEKVLNKTVGSCGQFTMSAKQVQSSPEIQVGSKTLDISNVTTATPKCSKGKFTPTTTKAYVTKSGGVGIPGYTAKTKVGVTISPDYMKKITFNKCGTAKMSDTKTKPIPDSFVFNGKTYMMSKLVTAPAAAKCSSKGISAPPTGGSTSDWGLPASAALIGDLDEDQVSESADNDDPDLYDTSVEEDDIEAV